MCNFTASGEPESPSLISQPTPFATTPGNTATFSASARGNPFPTYQWQKNNLDIPGATASSYTTPTLTLSDSGSHYRVVASNSVGSVTSNAVALTVAEPVPIEVGFLLDGEGTNGTVLTPALLQAMTRKTPAFPGGTWSLTGNWKIKNTGERRTLGPFSVGGTVYDDASGSTGLVLENSGADAQYVNYDFAPAFNGDFVFGAWISIPPTAPNDYPTLDLVIFELRPNAGSGPGYVVTQSTDYAQGANTPPRMSMHTNSGRGPTFPFEYDTWYWVTMEVKRNSNVRVSLYNVEGNLVGESSLSQPGYGNWKYFRFGHTDSHGDLGFTGEMRFDDIVMIANPTADDFPLGPRKLPPAILDTDPPG